MRAPLLAVSLWCASALFSCQQPCGPSTCSGCCDPDGSCVEAQRSHVDSSCGGPGLACTPSIVACLQPCGPSNCAGCCDPDGACLAAESAVVNARCGAPGLACTAAFVTCLQPCGPSTCAGCCDANGACVNAPDNATASSCGGSGLACATCGADQLCDPYRLVCITNSDPSACSSPPVQTLSQPCCTSYGADACGANLFCAAFDSRTHPTCYAEYSRLSLENCTEDRQCASRSCNTSESQCRSAQYEICTTQVGCVPTTQYGTPLNCVTSSSDETLRCRT